MNKEEFRNPPPDCRAVTFWSWNGALDEAETKWQVRELARQGVGGAVIHSRVGLSTEYLGKDWFRNCVAAVAEGRECGFPLWLYDEDRWPSGNCGGLTAAKDPEYRARALVMTHDNAPPRCIDTLWAGNVAVTETNCLARFRVNGDDGRPVDPQRAADGDVGPHGVSFYEVILPPSGRMNGGCYADLLHDGAVREFLRNTHERYAEALGQYFGREVPCVFTDEPTTSTFTLPWSARLAGEFRQRRGYDLLSKLPSLFLETPDAPRTRHDFWKTVHGLFGESYMAQVAKWCSDHHLAFTGHLNREHDLWSQIHSNGGVMEHYAHMDIPGIDILSEEIVEVDTCKQAASVCNQLGKERLVSELYGGTGYPFSFEGQKWVGDWQMALGVNALCLHLSFYTMKGCAKRDYPPSYFYQSPWWRHYKYMADYQARLCHVLRQGRPVRDILLVHPLTGAWCRFDPQSGEKHAFARNDFGLRHATRDFQETMDHLLNLHRDFDLGDEMIMAKHAGVDGTEMAVGRARYKVVMISPTRNLESSTVSLLEKYAEAGGKLAWVGEIPELVDGLPSDRAKRLALSERSCRVSVRRKHLDDVLNALLPRSVSVAHRDTHAEAEGVLCQERVLDDGCLLFLVNTNRGAAVPLTVRAPVTGGWLRWDCECGETHGISSRAAGGGSEAEVTLPPAGSMVLHISPNHPVISSAPGPRARTREVTVNPRGRWAFSRLAPNSLVLDRCRYCIDDEPFSEEMFMMDAQETWRGRFGLVPARGMANDIQPWKKLQEPKNRNPLARLTLQYTFQAQAIPQGEIHLVLEEPSEFEITVNGHAVDSTPAGWFMDKSFEKIPIREYLKRGRNTVELRTTLTAMKVMEDIYIIGDFAVNRDTLAIEREPRRIVAGDWCAQGYPFYTDGIVYKGRLSIPAEFRGRVAIELERFEGTVAAVWVHGQRAAVIGWRPYRADVTEFVRPGSNDLGIEVVGSPRNLMGPRHSLEKYPLTTYPAILTATEEPRYQMVPAGLFGNIKVIYSRGPNR